MKKLLVVSVLAAALVSTAAFAAPDRNASPAAPQLVVAKNVDKGFFGPSFSVAQMVINDLVNSKPSVGFKDIVVAQTGVITIRFDRAIGPQQRSTVTEAAMELSRISNNSNGYKVLSAKPGNDNILFTLTVLDPSKDSNKTSTIVAEAKGPTIILRQIADDNSAAKELAKLKNGSPLKAVVAK